MPRNDALENGELTDTSYYILLSLVEPKHGYLIMNTVEQMTDKRIQIGPASMYTTIKKLSAASLIKLYGEGEKKKKTYVITEKGRKMLESEIERKREMVRHGEEILLQLKEMGS
ncbi:PadR family transcriptional regulator [Halobacillus sp. A1]|uniref:PadR family transcriptional regulator n=1 Tax=Halobacillus campisalis TaxID=435909 RepID=A0ABW2K806_9BACI|nr:MULTISPECIES: PadR family transcriptional regulator [Halobacillus]MCP3032044.1 PadR family transcriptional regulator [Halobacillus sp. A1]